MTKKAPRSFWTNGGNVSYVLFCYVVLYSVCLC
nr:MAG TPA: hypothetical protein [Caudoviricetes sp.]